MQFLMRVSVYCVGVLVAATVAAGASASASASNGASNAASSASSASSAAVSFSTTSVAPSFDAPSLPSGAVSAVRAAAGRAAEALRRMLSGARDAQRRVMPEVKLALCAARYFNALPAWSARRRRRRRRRAVAHPATDAERPAHTRLAFPAVVLRSRLKFPWLNPKHRRPQGLNHIPWNTPTYYKTRLLGALATGSTKLDASRVKVSTEDQKKEIATWNVAASERPLHVKEIPNLERVTFNTDAWQPLPAPQKTFAISPTAAAPVAAPVITTVTASAPIIVEAPKRRRQRQQQQLMVVGASMAVTGAGGEASSTNARDARQPLFWNVEDKRTAPSPPSTTLLQQSVGTANASTPTVNVSLSPSFTVTGSGAKEPWPARAVQVRASMSVVGTGPEAPSVSWNSPATERLPSPTPVATSASASPALRSPAPVARPLGAVERLWVARRAAREAARAAWRAWRRGVATAVASAASKEPTRRKDKVAEGPREPSLPHVALSAVRAGLRAATSVATGGSATATAGVDEVPQFMRRPLRTLRALEALARAAVGSRWGRAVRWLAMQAMSDPLMRCARLYAGQRLWEWVDHRVEPAT